METTPTTPQPADPSQTPTTTGATPPPSEPPAAPPATRIVVEGTKTEREIELERELESARCAQKLAETNAAYSADEARRLKEIQNQIPPSPPRKKTVGVGWFEVEEGQ